MRILPRSIHVRTPLNSFDSEISRKNKTPSLLLRSILSDLLSLSYTRSPPGPSVDLRRRSFLDGLRKLPISKQKFENYIYNVRWYIIQIPIFIKIYK